jgi:hypothetical protein
VSRRLASRQKHYREWGILSLAVPPLGFGHGHLVSAESIAKALTGPIENPEAVMAIAAAT